MEKVFDEPSEYDFVKEKIVFLILFQSGEHNVVEDKITKLLGSFDCYIEPENDRSSLENLIECFKRKES